MPADPITSKHVESMLNIHLSKQAFVKEVNGDTVWWDGSPFNKGDRPPLLPQLRYSCHIREHYDETDDSGICCHVEAGPIQDYREAVSNGEGCDDFTRADLPGNVYLPDLDRMLSVLEWKHLVFNDLFTLPGLDGKRMSLFVPSFLELLLWLHSEGRDFVIVVRTFGSDIPRIIPALVAISQGLHPDLPVPNCVSAPSLFGSLVQAADDEFQLDLSDASCIRGNLEILDFFENLPSKSLILLTDDYAMWQAHNFDPCFGKPIFLDLARVETCRHFLFDDNVNLNPADSIAAVWLRTGKTSKKFRPLPLSTAQGRATIGTVLLQANLYNSIVNPQAFVNELIRAEKRYDSLVDRLLD